MCSRVEFRDIVGGIVTRNWATEFNGKLGDSKNGITIATTPIFITLGTRSVKKDMNLGAWEGEQTNWNASLLEGVGVALEHIVVDVIDDMKL